MREVDIVYLYEHAARELDVACAVTAILRQRGFTTEILQWPTSFFPTVGRFRPKLVVLPFCYTKKSFWRLLQYWSNAIFFNMTWEQLFYSGNRLAKTPRDDFALKHVVHHSWSEAYAELLRAQGIAEESIFVNGHPAYALYNAPYRSYFLPRETLAQRYSLDSARKWVFFPENYNWAFYTAATIEQFIKGGQSADDIEVMRRFCESSLTEVLRWCCDAAQHEEIELIIRPRPATHIDEFKTVVDKVLKDLPPHLHIIQDESVRDWIMAADTVVSSHSTSLIEAALAEKPAYILEPSPIPAVLHVEWHDLLPHLATSDDFHQVCSAAGMESNDLRLAEWARQTLLSYGDPIVNLAGILGRLVTGKIARPPVIIRKKHLSLAKQIIPEWLWVKYHQAVGRRTQILEGYRKDIVLPEELEARIQRWQLIMSDYFGQKN